MDLSRFSLVISYALIVPNPADRKGRFAQTGVPHDKVQFTVTTFKQLKQDLGGDAVNLPLVLSSEQRFPIRVPVTVLMLFCTDAIQ